MMTLVETITVGSGGAASMEFAGIPGDGKDLLLLISGRNSLGNFGAPLEINGSTANQSGIHLRGTGNSTNNGTGTAVQGFINPDNYTSNTFGNSSVYISNYASSTAKSVSHDGVVENNGTGSYSEIGAYLWDNTAAITSLMLYTFEGTYLEHTTASLYIIS